MQEKGQVGIKDYKDTLHLPQTSFPMKGDGPRREPEIQKFWFENNIYEKALTKRKSSQLKKFLLHDGPPYLSSGNIHIGTALNKILKDIVVKYKTLQGFYSPYLPGFDCHGLPIESAVLKDKSPNIQLSPLDIRRKCTEFVLQNRKLQEEKFKRLGVLGDWDNAYMTIYPLFEAQQLRLFGEMVQRGYIYRGLKPVYWCSACHTALAEAEVEYVDNHKSPSIYVAFPIVKLNSSAKKLEKYKDVKVIVWTTTPWTIPGNLAICLNEDFTYCIIRSEKFGHLLIALDLLSKFNEVISENCTVLDKLQGKELEHSVCKHPFYDRESPLILGKHVTLETGTGCVHTAPGHGLEDFVVSQKYGLGVLSPVDDKGFFTEEVGNDLKGLYVHKAGNQSVIELLNKSGALIKHEDYIHSYPYCWRSKTPIIFRATEQWFCSIEKFRKQALSEIDNVKWVPSVGRNRIYSMVESRSDWCISRQRVWGVPIPAFYCLNCNKSLLNKNIIEHISKLVEASKGGADIWWEKDINELLPATYKCECGSSSFKKEKDTMDVWFDSGSTHYTVVDQIEGLKGIKDILYLEGSDQHRGWFQSSLLTSVAIKNKAPYSIVLTHGFVLDENGRKMSKSLGNVVDPEKIIGEYGADILRLWVSSTDYSSDMRIGQNMLKQLAEVYRNIRNTMRFILGNLYDYDAKKNNVKYANLWNIDKYILHRLEEIKNEITNAFENYEFYKFYQILQNFCAVELSSFYFDIVKDRLYTANKKSRQAVQFVLKELLDNLIPIITSVLPHLAEDVWKHIPSGLNKRVESALCLDYPPSNSNYLNDKLVQQFKKVLSVKDIVYKALEIARGEKKIGKSLEAKVYLYLTNADLYKLLTSYKNELSTIFITSQVEVQNTDYSSQAIKSKALSIVDDVDLSMAVTLADGEKCPRCWKYSTDIGHDSKHSSICLSCARAVSDSF